MSYDRMVGDYGQTLEITAPGLDLTGTVQIVIRSPGATFTRSADSVDGQVVTYTLAQGDLVEKGEYKVFVVAIANGVRTASGGYATFTVGELP